MKPPVKLDDLMEEWSKDSVMDKTEPGEEQMRISNLHAKYLNIRTYHNIVYKKNEAEMEELRQFKSDYYSGKLNHPDDLKKHNLEPFELRLGPSSLQSYINKDEDVKKLATKLMINKEIVDYCDAVMKSLYSRVWSLRSYIDWQKFTNVPG